jgi:urate oxidase
MALLKKTYGKGRVRIMRVNRATARHEVRELSIKAMVEGDFGGTFTHADNSSSLCTDTVKNIVNIVARENIALDAEDFCSVLAQRFLSEYPQLVASHVTGLETKWTRLSVNGSEHAHSFLLDGNGKNIVEVDATRGGLTLRSGVDGFTFMKTTESGWDNFHEDRYTTLAPTRDRICATSMLATWSWIARPADYGATNAKILDTMLGVFATTYSESVQDSLYRMGSAALAAVPEIGEISMSCPNKHYIPINLAPFDLDNDHAVFLPTDEPHGQIECTVGRD